MRAHVYYPSGQHAEIDGQWIPFGKLPDPSDLYAAGFIVHRETNIEGTVIPRESAVLLDPRAVVVEKGGGVVYTPRDHGPFMLAEMRDWMDEHPEWPDILEVDGA